MPARNGDRRGPRLAIVAALTLGLIATPSGAALRSPQVQVAPNALANFFASRGQTINVVGDQLDLPFLSLDAGTTIELRVPLGTSGAVAFGGYNALLAVPPLYQMFPEFTPMNWFTIAAFRDLPSRVVINSFDAVGSLIGVNTYLGADRTAFGFYAGSASGAVYSEDARNPSGQPRILAYAATGAVAGSMWFACELTQPNGYFGDLVVLATFSTPPVGTKRTTWGRLQRLYR